MTTYQEAITVQTSLEVLEDTTAALAAEGVIVTGFSPTSAPRGLISLDARARAAEQAIRAEVVQAGFLVNVEARDPEWIDRMLEGFFQTTRLRATYAEHVFVLTNQSTTGGPYVIAPGQLEASTVDGVKFRNITGGTLNAGIGQTIVLEFRAVVAGLSGNIAPGEIFALTTGAIPGVDIANEVDSITKAARDDETNRQYTDRAIARWGTLAAGGHPLAVEYIILSSVDTITKVGIQDDNPFGPGTVGVYLANAAGPATNHERVAAEGSFSPKEPLGSRGLWSYLAATAATVNVTATLTSDGTNPNLAADATTALQSLQAQWPMKAGVVLDTVLIGGILRGLASEQYNLAGFRGCTDVDMSSPSADVVLGVSQVLVFNISLTVI